MVSDPPYGTTNFQSFWVEVLPSFGTTRDGLLEKLAEAGISGRRGIMAAHRQPAYRWRDSGGGLLQHTERLNDRTLILPVYHELDDGGLDRIIGAIRASAAGTRT